jgi:hypothetical protein
MKGLENAIGNIESSMLKVVAHSANDFSAIQGYKGWYNYFRTPEERFQLKHLQTSIYHHGVSFLLKHLQFFTNTYHTLITCTMCK